MMLVRLMVGIFTLGAAVGQDSPGSSPYQDAAMLALLRPYLDDDYFPESGPDSDKAFIRETIRRIEDALPARLTVTPPRRRRVLVVTQRTMGALHTPSAAGLLTLLRKSAGRHGALELTEITTDRAVTAEMLAGFHAVVVNNQSQPGDPKFHRVLLPEYVRQGGGLFAVHAAALIDSMKEDASSEYNRLLGAFVDRSAKYGHPGNHFAVFPVKLPHPDHPLAQAFRGPEQTYELTFQELQGAMRRKYRVVLTAPRQLSDELYVLLRAPDPDNKPTVLVEIDARNSEVIYPEELNELSHAITWIKPYGKGRVFYTQLGHNMAVYSIAAVARSLMDGLLYATGDLNVPGPGDTRSLIRDEPFVVKNHVAFRRIVPGNARLETIGCDFGDAEGPVWIGGEGGYLVFSDMRVSKLLKWSAAGGITTYREQSHGANGNALDPSGRLISCEQTARRIARVSPDGQSEEIASRFEGRRFSSPNDLAVRSDGTIWFTDPSYGPVAGGREMDGNYVFRIAPGGEVTIASRDLSMPNGICLSPDEKKLYVGQGGAGRLVKRFDIREDGTLSEGTVFGVLEGGVPDGMKCDRQGNVYVAGTDGVYLFAPDGTPIGTIRIPQEPGVKSRVTNVCFGGKDRRTLFITARNCLYRVGLQAQGF
jgi:gluconolactonase